MTNPLDYMGDVKNSTRLKAVEVLSRVSGANTITHVWGYDANPGNTEHHSGLAADFMVFSDKALGDRIYDYLWANRVRLGVRHIIWQQSITSTVVDPGVRRPMADRGNTTANHMDHVHVQFLTDSYTAPSATPALAKPASKPASVSEYLKRGVKSNAVRSLQLGLNRVFPAYSRLSVDGDFGPATESVVREFQRRSHIGADGIVGPVTRARLFAVGIRF